MLDSERLRRVVMICSDDDGAGRVRQPDVMTGSAASYPIGKLAQQLADEPLAARWELDSPTIIYDMQLCNSFLKAAAPTAVLRCVKRAPAFPTSHRRRGSRCPRDELIEVREPVKDPTVHADIAGADFPDPPHR